jgi:acetyl esterase
VGIGHPRTALFSRGIAAALILAAVVFAGGSGGGASERPAGAGTQAAGVNVMRDLTYYEVDGREMKYDAYVPPGPGPFPGVVLIYGGGWVLGSEKDWEPYARSLAAEGFATFAVEYRLAPQHPYPAAVNDVRASVAAIRARASDFRLDPARIGALGGSAGGHLSALLATIGEGPTDSGARVATAVSWAGPMDLHLAEYPAESHAYLDAFLNCRGAPCDEARVVEASPISHVDPTDGTMLLLQGTEDVLVPAHLAQRMAAALAQAGVHHQLVLIPNAGHDARFTQAVLQPTLDWLRARLGAPARPPSVVADASPPAFVPPASLPTLPPPTRLAPKPTTSGSASASAEENTEQAQEPTSSRRGADDAVPWVGAFVGALAIGAVLFVVARR